MWCHVHPHYITGLLCPFDYHLAILELVLGLDVTVTEVWDDVDEGFLSVEVLAQVLGCADVLESDEVTVYGFGVLEVGALHVTA